MAYSRDLPKMEIIDYHILSWTIMDYQGLSWTIMDYHNYPRLLKIADRSYFHILFTDRRTLVLLKSLSRLKK